MSGALPPPWAGPGCVWITGGGSGIGAALARALAAHGAQVVISGRRADALRDVAACRSGRIHPYPLDVCDHAGVMAAVAAIEAAHGPIKLAVLNAGAYHPTPAREFSAATVRPLVETNLMGMVNCLEALIAPMRARAGGHLALVASVAGYRGLPGAAGYSAAKAAIIAMAESLAFDLRRDQVRVSLINPGFVDTPMTRGNPFPMPDIITPDQAAQAIVRGLDAGGFEIAFPARFALVMKLLRLLPDRLFFPLVRRITGQH